MEKKNDGGDQKEKDLWGKVIPIIKKGGKQSVSMMLSFSPAAMEKVYEMCARTKLDRNNVVRNALRLYEWYLDQMAEGWKIHLVKDDVVKEVKLKL